LTKDGRPSRISDIRYFHPNRDSYLKGNAEAVAFGNRLAFYLNGEGYSLGTYSALYLLLTNALPHGTVRVTDDGGEWWQRYTHVGVPDSFPSDNGYEVAVGATVAALTTIRPDLASTVESAAAIVATHGEDLRFLVRRQNTKRYVIEISFNVATWPRQSHVFTSVEDRASGAFLEGPGLPHSHSFAPPSGPVRVKDIEDELPSYRPRQRPVTSKILRLSG
jgi:hypothetical protein